MAFHVACPITCKRICYCQLGVPQGGRGGEFLDQVEQFLRDPWVIRVCEGSTVQVPVPKVSSIVSAADHDDDVDDDDDNDELVPAASFPKKAIVSPKGFRRKFESGALVVLDASKDNTAEDQVMPNVNVMCRLCFSGENEGSERAKRMLPCTSCGKKYHKSCLKTWSQYRDLFDWSSWTCPSCRICEVCSRLGEPTKFKFCKRCDGAVHCYCMQPPHKNVSSGPYLCPKHTRCHSCRSNVPGNGSSVRWFLGYTCCDACGRLFTKGNYCPVCLKVYRDSEATPMICCDICQRWVHCECDAISDEKYLQFQTDGNLPYTCPTCRGECYQVRDLEDAVQELWRRRDEADKDLIASLRSTARLRTQQDAFSITPSDDQDNCQNAAKSLYGGGRFSFKSLSDFSPKNTNESAKIPSSEKHAKEKGFEISKMEQNHEGGRSRSLGFRLREEKKALNPPGPDMFASHVVGSLNSVGRICPTNEQGILKHKFVDRVAGNHADRKPTILQNKSQKFQDTGVGEDVRKDANKAKNIKGTKLVIHLGGRNKTITNSPRSDSSGYQREQDLTTLSGSEGVSQHRMSDYTVNRSDGSGNFDDGHRIDSPHQIRGVKPRERNIIKLGKGKPEVSDIHPKSGRGNGLFTPESAPIISSKRSNLPKDEVSLRKHPDNRLLTSVDSDNYIKQASPLLDASLNDSRPLLRLKFKTPYPGSWAPYSQENRASVKGQRSKRKRPSPLVEKPKHEEEDAMEPQDNSLMEEIMEASWVLKKLGKDAIGKRVAVNQPFDNSWHKGVVSDVEGTSMLSIDLDGGRSKIVEPGKQGIRFVPQKQTR